MAGGVAAMAFLLLGATALLLPLGGAQNVEAAPAGGVLYLTDTALSSQRDDGCAQGQTRYEMTVNGTRVAEGNAAASPLSHPARSCPTRFLYAVQSAFRLEGDMRVLLRLRCDRDSPGTPQTPAARQGSIDVVLTNDPNANTYDLGTPLDSNLTRPVTGARAESPSTCATQPFDVEIPLTVAGMDLSPGGTLTLMIEFYYTTGLDSSPRLEVLTGPDGGSRIEGAGIPSPADEAAGARSPPRTRLFWSATSQQGGDDPAANPPEAFNRGCNAGVPIYDMLPEEHPPEFGVIALSLSTPANFGCVSMLEYNATQAFTLQGSLSVRFWFRCADPSLGSPNDFQLRFRRIEAHQLPGGVGPEIATPARTGNVASFAACPQAPVEITAESVLPEAAPFEVGERFRVEIIPFYANGPYAARDQFSQVEVLVGPEHHSHIEVAGLPWQARADPEGPGLPGAPIRELVGPVPVQDPAVDTSTGGRTPSFTAAVAIAGIAVSVALAGRRG